MCLPGVSPVQQKQPIMLPRLTIAFAALSFLFPLASAAPHVTQLSDGKALEVTLP
jgi:hypothetical protein